ncbi:hypothetical protein HJG60_010565 [Phyllostomus discolor]|uniref:Uncharacterized protein n=1 Tax=Phyllostomus discolor TaxID=89673 RepID=A0A834ALG8_9CHIR|nr:hypothetical protein HJG60_010565 [Phyllostomus discolor]
MKDSSTTRTSVCPAWLPFSAHPWRRLGRLSLRIWRVGHCPRSPVQPHQRGVEAVCLSSHPCLGTRRPALFSSAHPRGTVLSLLPRLCKALAIWKRICCWWDLGLSSLYFDHFLYLSRHPVLYPQGGAWSFRQQEKSLALTVHSFLKVQGPHDIE